MCDIVLAGEVQMARVFRHDIKEEIVIKAHEKFEKGEVVTEVLSVSFNLVTGEFVNCTTLGKKRAALVVSVQSTSDLEKVDVSMKRP